MKTRFAFVGFRHSHIFDLLEGVQQRQDAEVAAWCEEDASTREALALRGPLFTEGYSSFKTMLQETECDAIAIGDTYRRRGELAIEALRAGKHVLSDKPLCTTLAEQEQIERTAAENRLCVGLQLDSRDRGSFRALRETLLSGELGELCTFRIEGEHPLRLNSRPGWYFKPGEHGGTINDIGIHAFDFVPWITNLQWREILAARSWNAKAVGFPHFHDCAQIMGSLENGAGVLADFSYVAPDHLGYELEHYWRLLVHGTKGMAETHLGAKEITLIKDADTAPERRPVLPDRPRGFLEDFLREVRGVGEEGDLSSADCLRASRQALEAQAAASP